MPNDSEKGGGEVEQEVRSAKVLVLVNVDVAATDPRLDAFALGELGRIGVHATLRYAEKNGYNYPKHYFIEGVDFSAKVDSSVVVSEFEPGMVSRLLAEVEALREKYARLENLASELSESLNRVPSEYDDLHLLREEAKVLLGERCNYNG